MNVEQFSRIHNSTGKILEDAEGFGLFAHISDLDVEKSQWIMAIYTVLNDIPKQKVKAVFRKNKIKFNYLAFVDEITPRGKRRYSKEELAELEREATIADYRDFYEGIVLIANDMASIDATCPDEEMIQKCKWIAAICIAVNDVLYHRANHILGYRGIIFSYNQFVENNVQAQ
jgi:hypothetical protein